MEVSDYCLTLGWAVFACKFRQKTPLASMFPRGVLDATRDPLWRRRAPHCNVAVACGLSGVVVIDIDPRSGGDEMLAEFVATHGALPITPIQRTGGGGAHYVFKDPGVPLCAKPAPGIDCQSGNKYFLVQPSVTTAPYEWELGYHVLDTPLADMPAWLLELCRAPPATPVTHLTGDAATCPVALAFARRGLLLRVIDSRRVAVCCPLAVLHSQNSPSSTIVFAPSAAAPRGSFYCNHSHPKLSTRDALEMIGESV